MSEPVPGDAGADRPRRKGRGRVPAWVRRSILAAVVGGLVVGNGYVLRKQFPPAERRRNAAYDAGLRALDLEPRDFLKAEMEFRRFLELDPRSARVRHLLGVALQFQGKIPEARAEYARALEQDPGLDDARIALAELALAEQSFEEAFDQLDRARADEPTPTAVFVLRARIMAQTGDQDGAVAAYREAIRRDPGSYESAIELGDLLMSRSVLGGSVADRQAAAGVYHDAEELCRQRLANTEDKRLRLLLAKAISGQARVLQHRQLEEAVVELRKAADLDPDDAEPAILLGGFFRAAGNFEEAARILEDARRKWKTPKTHVALFELYRDQRRNEDALKVLTDAVALWIDDAAMRVRLIGFLTSVGRFDDAEREADAAQQLFSKDDQVLAARGDLARERAVRAERDGNADLAAENRAKALASYRRALEIRPKSLRLKKLVAGELIESVARKPAGAEMSPDEEFARRCIEEVLRVNARDAEALAWRSRLAFADGKFDEVVKSLKPVLGLAAPPLDSLRLLGAAAARVADHALAADAFARVVELQRDAEREKPGAAEGGGPSAGDWWNAVRSALDAGRQDVAIELGAVAVRMRPESPDLRRELAAAHLARGDADKALEIARSARVQFPGDAGVRFLMARAYESLGRLDAAEDELKSAAVDVPGEASRMAYFEFLARTGRVAGAEQGFLAMVAADPDGPAGYLRLGDFYLSLDPPRTDEALARYEKALELTHGGAAPLLRIAELHLARAARDPASYAAAAKSVEAFAKAAPADAWCDYLSGKLALAGGRPDEALPALARFVAKMPLSASGLYYHARALRESGRTEEALAALERAAKIDRSDRSIHLELATLRHEAGIQAFQKGDFASAQRLFAAAEAGGAGRGSRLFLAGAQANAGEFEMSEKECRRLLDDEPSNPAAIHLLAQLLLRRASKETLDETETLYRRALKVDPSDLLAKIGIGTVRFERGDFPGALEEFKGVYPQTDGAPSLAMAIAQCMALMNDSAGAASFLDAEIQARPKSDAMHHLKGDFLVHQHQPLDASREFMTAFALNPDNHGALLAAAAALMDARDFDGARRLLTENLPKVKEPGIVNLALGEALLRSGREAEAGDALRQALSQLPDHPRALYLLGRIAEHGGNKAEAKRLYRESSRRGSVDGDAFARLAQFAAAEGDRRTAIEMYGAALKYQPRNVTYLNNLATLLGEEEGRMEDAVRAAQNAYALDPETPEIADTYGWLLFRAGRTKEAAVRLEPAANRLQTNAILQFHAGMALSRLSRTTDARDLLKRALRIDPNFAGADAARAELEKLR